MIQPTAVLFDLDSTLAESKQPITKPMAQQLAQLSKKMPFGVISGGQLSQLVEQVINELPPNAS
ncbi:HAD family hydrolase, partial [Shewanella algae]|uniref:hypothetical protein n=1 Tax=Shewanella algae TaxID=38313 RepID=UPI00313F7FBC